MVYLICQVGPRGDLGDCGAFKGGTCHSLGFLTSRARVYHDSAMIDRCAPVIEEYG